MTEFNTENDMKSAELPSDHFHYKRSERSVIFNQKIIAENQIALGKRLDKIIELLETGLIKI